MGWIEPAGSLLVIVVGIATIVTWTHVLFVLRREGSWLRRTGQRIGILVLMSALAGLIPTMTVSRSELNGEGARVAYDALDFLPTPEERAAGYELVEARNHTTLDLFHRSRAAVNAPDGSPRVRMRSYSIVLQFGLYLSFILYWIFAFTRPVPDDDLPAALGGSMRRFGQHATLRGGLETVVGKGERKGAPGGARSTTEAPWL